MILHDTVELLSGRGEVMMTVKAHIGQAVETELNRDYPGQVIISDALQMIIKATPLATQLAVQGRRYRWRGQLYVGKEPVVRRRRGKDHHYTIELTRGNV